VKAPENVGLEHPARIFISYTHADGTFVQRLIDGLQQSGLRPWIDKLDLRGGDSLIQKIGSAISASTYMLAIISPRSVRSKWVNEELSLALTVQFAGGDLTVIPIVRSISAEDLPPFLRSRLCIDFTPRGPKKFEQALRLLIASLDRDQTARQVFEIPPIVEARPSFEDIVEIAKDTDPKWLSTMMNLPLRVLLERTIELRAFEGDARNEVLVALAMTSNSSTLAPNNYLALVQFAMDLDRQRISSPSTHFISTAIAESRYISPTFRRVALAAILNDAASVTRRRDKLNLLPNIFRPDRFDPLADELVEECLSRGAKKQTPILHGLWEVDAPLYREEIIRYIHATSAWSRDLRHELDAISLMPTAVQAFGALRRHWKGLISGQHSNLSSFEAETALRDVDNFPVEEVIRIPSYLEYFSRTHTTANLATSLTLALLAPKNLARLKAGGTGLVFNMLARTITSPYTSAMASAILMEILIVTFGVDSLDHVRELPPALLVNRPNNFDPPEPKSTLDMMIDLAAQDAGMCNIVNALVKRFPSFYVLAAVRMKCKTLDMENKYIASLHDFATSISEVKSPIFYGDSASSMDKKPG
jgi:hypothetical protein